ncbi:MAG: hypothetical protein KDA32_03235 [Phycisphaerales bacterium]|nr:hypothetical protein [Phycisphaerales bacterium]
MTEQRSLITELAGAPTGWGRILGLFVIALLVYVIIWLYRREARAGASAGLRLFLAALRCAVLALLVVVWLEPVQVEYITRTIPATTIVLVDQSTSMAITDASAGEAWDTEQSRAARVRRLLTDRDYTWLRRMRERNQLAIYGFGERSERLPPAPGMMAPVTPTPEKQAAPVNATTPDSGVTLVGALAEATRPRTDVGKALDQVLDDLGDTPLAGVVLITDGEVNAGMSLGDVAAYADRLDTAFYPVGIGDTVEPPNVRIAQFVAPGSGALGDPIEMRVEVAATGFERTSATLMITRQRLREGGEEGPEERVYSEELELSSDRPIAEARFEAPADEAGEYLFRARLAPVDGEAIESDNLRQAPVVVLDESVRVLIVAGRPNFSYRYVTRLLERDPSINVSCWLQSADRTAIRDGDTVITELPQRDDLLQYDAILLLDPNPADLDSGWAINVRRLVDELGGGLLYQAGPQFSSQFLRDPRLEDIISMLPAQPDTESTGATRSAFLTDAMSLVPGRDGAAHPLTQLNADPQLNAAMWAALPGVYWLAPVLREKPLASVPLRVGREDGPVALATQPFGAGRVVFEAFPDVWRWRSVAEARYNSFWIQTVRYLSYARRQGQSRRGVLSIERDTLQVGEFVRVEAQVLDERFSPWVADSVDALIEAADGPERRVTLEAQPERPGWFAARFVVDWVGPATIRVPLPGSDDHAALVKHVQSLRSDLELRALRLRETDLKALADATGGTYVGFADAGRLPDLIADATQTPPPTRGPENALWDEPWLLLSVFGLLAVEWTIRRRSHLL